MITTQTQNKTRQNYYAIYNFALSISFFLLNTLFAKFYLPFPGTCESVFQTCFGLPSKNLVCLLWISPNLLDISGTATNYLVVQLNARNLFEGIDKFKNRNALSCSG